MQLAKLDSGQLVTTCADNEDREMINQMVSDGFKLLIGEAIPPEVNGFQKAHIGYREEPDRIVTYYEIIDTDPEKVMAEIARLQSELSATDYQIIKSYEYSLAGEPSPYDITSLHVGRQQLRNRINELEQLC